MVVIAQHGCLTFREQDPMRGSQLRERFTAIPLRNLPQSGRLPHRRRQTPADLIIRTPGSLTFQECMRNKHVLVSKVASPVSA